MVFDLTTPAKNLSKFLGLQGLFSIINSSLWGIQGMAIARMKEAIGQTLLTPKALKLLLDKGLTDKSKNFWGSPTQKIGGWKMPFFIEGFR
ncbi:hypothetical protein NG796_15370 [Laspinema sp. A4]|uniref:hypothetical protein n=1 Tax=Laspinema sp. D2d TaxID=2953686 RepID=UPI0021BA99E8|nr:hypothetical protein [Laspinema sp. D2d]MCT7984677.1 hypothetical protein [Laspinema sp. D2d]